jgi:hypothetical protein
MASSFKSQYDLRIKNQLKLTTLDERKQKAANLREQYPDRIPVSQLGGRLNGLLDYL